jgi:hypothetical protein
MQKKKEEESAREKELSELFKVAISQPKVPLGVDPKSIVCEFFRHGQCAKGFKCKFSHDLSVERKGEKIDIYSDQRDGDAGVFHQAMYINPYSKGNLRLLFLSLEGQMYTCTFLIFL